METESDKRLAIASTVLPEGHILAMTRSDLEIQWKPLLAPTGKWHATERLEAHLPPAFQINLRLEANWDLLLLEPRSRCKPGC